MSVQLVNGSAILPTRPNWRDPVTWKRSWQTTIAGALQGQEDRRALRRIPQVTLNWLITTLSTEESAVLETRIQAALKSGLACTGYWGHAAEIATDVTGTSAVIEPGSWPWAAGDYVLFINPDTATFDAIKVDSVSGNTLTLHSSVSQKYKACWLCWPIIFGKLQCDPLAPFTSDKIEVKLTLLNALPSPASVPATADWCGHCNPGNVSIFAPCPTITISGMPTAGTFGTALTGQLMASGGIGPYTYAVTSGALPTGGSVNSAGAFSGTPSAIGTFTGAVTVTDTATGCTGTASFSITIACATMATPGSLLVDGNASGTGNMNSLSPTLTWGAVTGAANYVVKIYSGGSCGGAPLHTSPTLGSATYTVPGGVMTNPCLIYSWQVIAAASTGYCANTTSACCEMSLAPTSGGNVTISFADLSFILSACNTSPDFTGGGGYEETLTISNPVLTPNAANSWQQLNFGTLRQRTWSRDPTCSGSPDGDSTSEVIATLSWTGGQWTLAVGTAAQYNSGTFIFKGFVSAGSPSPQCLSFSNVQAYTNPNSPFNQINRGGTAYAN